MSLEDDRALVVRAHQLWADGDLAGFIACLADDVVYTVNVDGLQVPYAASANGRDAVGARLQLLLDTFHVQAFVIEQLVQDARSVRTTVLGYYKHKRTNERLDIRPRFHVQVRDGVIARVDELHDAAYVEAFQRFVAHLEAEAAAAGNSSDASP